MEVAVRIGRRLARDAFWDGGRCAWVGCNSQVVDGTWRTVWRALGSHLYDGAAGITRFLASLASASGDRILRLTAHGALSNLESLAESSRDGGLYIGGDGLALTLLEAGLVLDRTEAVKRGVELFLKTERASGPDVLSGIAGQIQALVRAAALLPEDALLNRAEHYGEALLAMAAPAGPGLGWVLSDSPGIAPLAGYSHGAAGIACAFAELAAHSDNAAFLDAARRALDYERILFDASVGNWQDLRREPPAQEQAHRYFAVSWCNGAPGIGLGRLRLLQTMPAQKEMLEREIAAAIAATQNSLAILENDNYSLCHGACGALEFLAEAARALQKSELLETVHRHALDCAARIEGTYDAWPSGVISKTETPSLMLGLAGIGYFYLRLAIPDAFPSALVVHRPAA